MILGGVILQEIPVGRWAELAVSLAILAALTAVALRGSSAIRAVLFGVAGLLVVRLLLLGNPWAWQSYVEELNAGIVGWRQYDLVRIERARFTETSPALRYLAVGSSQTEAVYGGYAEAHGDFDLFVVAAMMPMDFVLYADDIVRRDPRTVLLYLSDFDIAKRPSSEATVLSPRQGTDIVKVADLLRSMPVDTELHGVLTELAVGEVFPEYRFRFVFRGLLDKQFRRVAGRLGRADAYERSRSTEQERIRWLREGVAPQYMPFNLAWLEEFLDLMNARGIEVIIVEGDYHPVVPDQRMQTMKTEVGEALMRLASEERSVMFIATSELPALGPDDYRDLTHVTPEAGARFAEAVMARIRSRQVQSAGVSDQRADRAPTSPGFAVSSAGGRSR